MTALDPKGYRYVVTAEQIHKYSSLTPQQKLEWLEEANSFVEMFLPAESRRLQRLFRRGLPEIEIENRDPGNTRSRKGSRMRRLWWSYHPAARGKPASGHTRGAARDKCS